jgi:hypothetical protein
MMLKVTKAVARAVIRLLEPLNGFDLILAGMLAPYRLIKTVQILTGRAKNLWLNSEFLFPQAILEPLGRLLSNI